LIFGNGWDPQKALIKPLPLLGFAAETGVCRCGNAPWEGGGGPVHAIAASIFEDRYRRTVDIAEYSIDDYQFPRRLKLISCAVSGFCAAGQGHQDPH